MPPGTSWPDRTVSLFHLRKPTSSTLVNEKEAIAERRDAMNPYGSLKQKKSGGIAAAVVLLMGVVLSAVMLFSRLLVYSPEDQLHYIPLTESDGITQVVSKSASESNEVNSAEGVASASSIPTAFLSVNFRPAAEVFQVVDETKTWEGKTEIEIFKISYENGDGRITVNSNNGSKVLAPGTANRYEFALLNTGSHAVEYEMSMEAYISDGTHMIPVEAKVYDSEGRYLAGSAERFVDVLELNQVQAAGTLKDGYVQPYTLEWQWPFENDDAYDTMLGNLAVDEEISLTIVINTVASYTPEEGGGIPQTGDANQIGLILGVMGGCVLVLLLLLWKKRSGNKNEKE